MGSVASVAAECMGSLTLRLRLYLRNGNLWRDYRLRTRSTLNLSVADDNSRYIVGTAAREGCGSKLFENRIQVRSRSAQFCEVFIGQLRKESIGAQKKCFARMEHAEFDFRENIRFTAHLWAETFR